MNERDEGDCGVGEGVYGEDEDPLQKMDRDALKGHSIKWRQLHYLWADEYTYLSLPQRRIKVDDYQKKASISQTQKRTEPEDSVLFPLRKAL